MTPERQLAGYAPLLSGDESYRLGLPSLRRRSTALGVASAVACVTAWCLHADVLPGRTGLGPLAFAPRVPWITLLSHWVDWFGSIVLGHSLQTCECSLGVDCYAFTRETPSYLATNCTWADAITQPELRARLHPIIIGTRRCDQYTQYWASILGIQRPSAKGANVSSSVKPYPAARSSRAIALAVPSGAKPDAGWPFVVYYSFMSSDGILKACVWPAMECGANLDMPGGLLDPGLDPLMFDDLYDSSDMNGWHPLQKMLHGFVNTGYAVLVTSMYESDVMSYRANCSTQGKEDDDYDYDLAGCWADGANPDAQYLRIIFEELLAGVLFPGVDLDFSRMGMMGFSVGAHMVSRSINEYPTLRTTLSMKPFPAIKAGVMTGGASYLCYSYWEGIWNVSMTPPANYLPCADLIRGCCPHDQTEARFDDGTYSWDSHPPMLFLETVDDSYADPRGSQYYYDVMAAKSSVLVCNVVATGSRHGLTDILAAPAVNFIRRHV